MLKVLVAILNFLNKRNIKLFEKARKYITFLIELLGGDTSVVIDNVQNFVNDLVKKIELLDLEIKAMIEKNVEVNAQYFIESSNLAYNEFLLGESNKKSIEELKHCNEVLIKSSDELEKVKAKLEKMKIKYDLVLSLLLEHLNRHKIEYTLQAINLAIECAVSRYFTKKIK